MENFGVIVVSFVFFGFFAQVGLLCGLLTLLARFSSTDGLALCLGPWATLLAPYLYPPGYDEFVLT